MGSAEHVDVLIVGAGISGIAAAYYMHTLGYSFRPWREEKAIAGGPSILKYIRETAAAYGIDQKIRFGHQVRCATWSSADATWTVEAERASDTGHDNEIVRFTCNF